MNKRNKSFCFCGEICGKMRLGTDCPHPCSARVVFGVGRWRFPRLPLQRIVGQGLLFLLRLVSFGDLFSPVELSSKVPSRPSVSPEPPLITPPQDHPAAFFRPTRCPLAIDQSIEQTITSQINRKIDQANQTKRTDEQTNSQITISVYQSTNETTNQNTGLATPAPARRATPPPSRRPASAAPPTTPSSAPRSTRDGPAALPAQRPSTAAREDVSPARFNPFRVGPMEQSISSKSSTRSQ